MAIGWRNQYTRYREYFLNIVNLYKQKADLRAFLEIILSLSTIIIFVIFALKPTILTIISLVREIDEKKKIVLALTQKVTDLGTAGEVYVENQDSIPMINSAISTAPSPEDISKQILAIAAKNSTEVMGISIGQVTLIGNQESRNVSFEFKPLPENVNEMPFSVSVRGNYSDLLGFSKDFENSRIPSRIDILGINSNNTDTEQVIVAIISGRIPFLGGVNL